ncbi:MAG: nucleoside-triphosphatase [Spirochaetales bacterium]|nr:nucleoside-triphosphatase [Spirochaetales bacterium]
MVTIITGELHRGKTTRVKELLKTIPDARGFVTEVVFAGEKRLGYDLRFIIGGEPGLRTPFMRLIDDAKRVGLSPEAVQYQLGKYVFFKEAFDRAEGQIQEILENPPSTIVIEELGFLERDKKGFYPLVRAVLDSEADLITAVRTSTLPGIIEAFALDDYRLIEVS